MEQPAPLKCITGQSGEQRDRRRRSDIRGNRMTLGGPSPNGAGRRIGLGGDDGDRAVYLSADTVARHLPRFSDLDADDWLRVQRIVDEGEWNTGGPEKRLLWIEDNDKPWLVVLKRTVRDEIYLQSYRRARSQEIRRIRGRQGEPGGPQPPPPNICRAG